MLVQTLLAEAAVERLDDRVRASKRRRWITSILPAFSFEVAAANADYFTRFHRRLVLATAPYYRIPKVDRQLWYPSGGGMFWLEPELQSALFRSYWEGGIIKVVASVALPWIGGLSLDLFEFTG